jgi:molybdate/tungstate transport system substrate-binding protein
MRKYFNLSIVIFLLLTFSCKCNREGQNNELGANRPSGKLVIFHAGSLSVPLKEIASEYNELNPSVEILMEAAGSLSCVRKLTELNQQCDIIALADYQLIDMMLIPDYCQWNIPFAGNEMIIAYTPHSKYADELSIENWYKIMGKKDVRIGRSDPNSDPCGYRAVMTMQLADLYYQQGVSGLLSAKDKKYIRPKETDLLALLETRELDYIFIYRSVAIQHQLNYLILPDSINLKRADLKEWYSKSGLEVTGSVPGKMQKLTGEPMVYGISIPDKAAAKDLAEDFLAFLLDSEKGMRIMEKNGQSPIGPIFNANYAKVPVSLQKFVLEK